MINPRVKTVSSTSSVDFRNTSGAFYDMIISIQNQTIDQSLTITDTEGNLITEQPITLTVPAKVILKDVKVGTLSFSDTNSYNIIISYIVKETVSGIPYVDIDYQNGYIYSQETGEPSVQSFTGSQKTFSISPPSGKKWILRSIIMEWTAAATQTDYPQVEIIPSSLADDAGYKATVLNLAFIDLSVTAGDDYAVDLAEYVQSRSSAYVGEAYVSEVAVPNGFVLYPNEVLSAYVGDETATIDITLSYIEVNLG